MDYMSTLKGLEGFWNALAGCYEHQIRAWAILYPLVKVRGLYKLLIVVNIAPSSL